MSDFQRASAGHLKLSVLSLETKYDLKTHPPYLATVHVDHVLHLRGLVTLLGSFPLEFLCYNDICDRMQTTSHPAPAKCH